MTGKLDKRVKTNAEAIAELAGLTEGAASEAKLALRDGADTARALAALRTAVASGEAITASIATRLAGDEEELTKALARLGSNEGALKDVSTREWRGVECARSPLRATSHPARSRQASSTSSTTSRRRRRRSARADRRWTRSRRTWLS